MSSPDVTKCVLQKLLGASDAHNAVLPALPAGMGGVASHGEMTRRGLSYALDLCLPNCNMRMCYSEAFQREAPRLIWQADVGTLVCNVTALCCLQEARHGAQRRRHGGWWSMCVSS